MEANLSTSEDGSSIEPSPKNSLTTQLRVMFTNPVISQTKSEIVDDEEFDDIYGK